MRSDAAFLAEICQQSIIERGYETIPNERKIEADDIDRIELTEKILLLPESMQSLLFMKYIFYLDPNTVENILSISNAKQKLRYAKALLAYSLRLPSNQFIAKICMKQAVKDAFNSYMLGNNTDIVILRPHYSGKFRNQLKEIKSAQRYNSAVTLKKIGITIIAAILSFAMALTVSAELRVRIFSWLVETFPQFSRFSVVGTLETRPSEFARLQNMKLNYIPSEFTLVEILESDPMVVYRYEDSSGKFLSVNARTPTGSPISFDTEDTKINEVIYNDQVAYWWYSDGLCYFIWQQEGFEIKLFGQISYEELIKIAENIQI